MNGSIIQPSKEWSTKGENSLKITRTHETLMGSITVCVLTGLTGSNSFTFEADVYSPNNVVNIFINDGDNIGIVRIPENSLGRFSVSAETTNSSIKVMCTTLYKKSFYLDNIELIRS